jgi:hypothetical protein
MILGRDALQVVTTIVYALTLAVIAYKLYRYRRSWLAFVPLVINVGLTIAFYVGVFVFAGNDTVKFGDLSAMLRLETGLTILIYAVYMPIGGRV